MGTKFRSYMVSQEIPSIKFQLSSDDDEKLAQENGYEFGMFFFDTFNYLTNFVKIILILAF